MSKSKSTPMRAIRKKCIDCCGYDYKEVRLCAAEKCPLWDYRLGHRPKTQDEEITSENR